MAQKRKTDQSKLDAAARLLEKLEGKTARAVKGNLGDNWRDNLFEIMMTRIELAAPHKKVYAAIPGELRHEPKKAPEFARRFFRTMRGILKLAQAPASPIHVAAFGILYVSVINAFLNDGTKDHSKTMAVLDQRLRTFEHLASYSPCKKIKEAAG